MGMSRRETPGTPMLRQILPSELQPDMRVVKIVFADDAESYPDIDPTRATPAKIRDEAIKAFWIDDGLPENGPAELSFESFSIPLRPEGTACAATAATVPFEEAFHASQQLQKKSARVAQDCFARIRKDGDLHLEPITGVVSEIVTGVDHNPNAMLAMRSLQKADAYTWNHCFNVATLSVVFSKFLGYTQQQAYYLGLAGFLHDVGKQFIPLNILNAPRRLSPNEFRIMQQHSELGFKRLLDIKELPDVVRKGILEHHEKADGTGYPAGRRLGEINPIASVVSVVDVYDALSSNRPYKTAMPAAQALSYIYGMRESAFPPLLAERFIRCVGIYPTGSLVTLSDGNMAVVQEPGSKYSEARVVVLPKNRTPMQGPFRVLDLVLREEVRITGSLDPVRYGINCTKVLERAAH